MICDVQDSDCSEDERSASDQGSPHISPHHKHHRQKRDKKKRRWRSLPVKFVSVFMMQTEPWLFFYYGNYGNWTVVLFCTNHGRFCMHVTSQTGLICEMNNLSQWFFVIQPYNVVILFILYILLLTNKTSLWKETNKKRKNNKLVYTEHCLSTATPWITGCVRLLQRERIYLQTANTWMLF